MTGLSFLQLPDRAGAATFAAWCGWQILANLVLVLFRVTQETCNQPWMA